MNVKKIKILYFNLFTWLGGGEYSIYYLAKNIDRSRFDPILLFNKNGPFVDKAKENGIESVIIPFVVTHPLALLKPGNIIENIKASGKITRLLKQREVDVVQCSDVFSLLLLIPALIRFRLPVVYSVIVFYSTVRCWFFNILALLFVDRIVANSDSVKNHLLNKTVGLDEISEVAYNGVDTSLFFIRSREEKNKIRTKLTLPLQKKIIGLVGRYEVWKGHLTFLDAAKRLLQKRDDLVFMIVGGAITSEVAPEVERFKSRVLRRIDDLNLRSFFVLYDHRDDIPEIMAALDVCVCPSDYEPYGLVVLEAYESGIPVVASRTVGALEVLRDNRGVFIAEPMDPDSFAYAISMALDFNESVFASAAGQTFSEKVNWKTYAQSFEDLYEKVERK
ncbi:MAG: glycosyltransferase family 4 protein [Ignavibacteriales bacterium]|nr:glycosyltransferase family 4 protein [Ignavibacteriales bacterium]